MSSISKKAQLRQQREIQHKANIAKIERRKETSQAKFEEESKYYNGELNKLVSQCLQLFTDNEEDNNNWIELFRSKWKLIAARTNKLNKHIRLNHESFDILLTRYIDINTIILSEPKIKPEMLLSLKNEQLHEMAQNKEIQQAFLKAIPKKKAAKNGKKEE